MQSGLSCEKFQGIFFEKETNYKSKNKDVKRKIKFKYINFSNASKCVIINLGYLDVGTMLAGMGSYVEIFLCVRKRSLEAIPMV